LTPKELQAMMLTIEEAKAFTQAHMKLMMDTKELLEKFSLNKDAYMVENSKFVCDYLTVYEQHNLQGYNDGGYAYRNSNFSCQLKKSDIEVAKVDSPSLIDRVAGSFKSKISLAEAQLKASVVGEADEVPFLKQEASKVLAKFVNPYK
jgi:hypothetical protein